MIRCEFVVILCLLLYVGTAVRGGYFESSLGRYIGDGNSSDTFKGLSSEKRMIGILFTNGHCGDCRYRDGELADLIGKMWTQNKVEVYRCELSVNPGMQQEFGVKRFPMLHFVLFRRGSYRIYHNYQMVLLDVVRRVVFKLQYYLATEGTDRWDQSQQERILLSIDELGYIEDWQQIVWSYGLNSLYYNLPLISIRGKDSFTMAVRQALGQEHSFDACTLYISSINQCFAPVSVPEFQHILSLAVFESVVEFTEASYRLYESLNLNRYIFVAVLDSIFDRAGSQQHIGMLNGVLKQRQFRGKITVFWMEAQINKQKLEHLGFTSRDHPPLFAQFSLLSKEKNVLKKGKEPLFTQQSIVAFIKSVIKVDEEEQTREWNRELLSESLRRLKLSRDYPLLTSKQEVQLKGVAFLLCFPYLEYELLGNSQIFYEMLLNYRYFVERVKRFAIGHQIKAYLLFEEAGCTSSENGYGLFLYNDKSCNQLSSGVVFDHKQVATTKHLRETINLPHCFYINEDDYQLQGNCQPTEPQFDYVFIDI